MKLGKFTLILAAIWGASAFSTFGQGVGINTTGAPANPNSMLDVVATGKGMLIPRMAWANKPAGLTASDAGMIIYSTDGDGTNGPGFYFFNGTIWPNLMASTASASGTYIENQSSTVQTGRFRIDGNGIFDGGNVGVGTITPGSKIDVYQALSGSSNAIIKAMNSTQNSTFNTSSGSISSYSGYFSNSSSRSAGGNDLVNVALYSSAINGQLNYAAIFDQGNVGIGSLSPSEKLDVNGNVKISGLSTSVAYSSISLPKLLVASSTGKIHSTLGGPNEVLKMDGTGTQIEWGNLSVTSINIPASTGDMLYYNGTNWVVLNVPNTTAGGTGVYYALTLPNAGTGTPSWQATTAFTVNGDNMGNCIASSNIDLNTHNLIGTGNININGKIISNGIQELSDFRFKKNIKPLTNVLSKVLSLQGVSYDWKTEEFPEKSFSDKTEFGFIAQELEKYFPNVVLTDENGYKSVQYSHMVPVLLEAIKEQQRLIDQLQGTVSNLSNVLYGSEKSNSIENASVELNKK